MITLQASTRDITGKAGKALIAQDLMPAVVYGPKHEAQAITVSYLAFTKILRDSGETSVIDLTGLAKPLQVLIHEVDRDPVTETPRHADFYAIEKGAKVEVAVPLSFIGESDAVKGGANLVKVMHELDISADAANLPHELEIDISSLVEMGDQIHVKDIKLPKGVTTEVDGEEVVALIQEVAVEAEEAPVLDMDAIEVEKKGKTEEAEAE